MKEEKKKRRFGIKGIIIVVLLIILLMVSLIQFFTDWMWFGEMGYVSVFFTKLFTQLKIGIPTFIIITFLAYIYFKFLKRGYYNKIESDDPVENPRLINLISWGLAAIFGGIVTYFAVSQLWFKALQFFNSTDFDIKDPLFKNDVSFYTFKLEFITGVNNLLIGVLVIFLIMTLVYYLVLMSTRKPRVFETEEGQAEEEQERYDGSEGFSGGQGGFKSDNIFGNFGSAFSQFGKNFNKNINRAPRQRKQFDDENIRELLTIASKQLIIVGALFFLMLGVHFFLKQYSLLFGSTGAVYGAGFTDINITLWVYRILMGLAILGVILFIIGVLKKRFKIIFTIPVIMIIVGVIGMGAGMLVQNFVVSPDEINKESKYLERNIEYTQYAYDLNEVDRKQFAANYDLSTEDIKKNEATLSNIRINDYLPAEKFYNQTQSIRQYYTFNDVDVDRYMVNGEYTQTFLSAREIDETRISETWINTHLKYTHGYGITMSRVDKITESGQPDMLVDNIPPESQVDEIKVTRPETYFGESTNNYIIVGTDEDEFDYPDGDKNAYTRYEGSAGIKLNPLSRVLFSIRERSLKLLVSSNISSQSRIIINRNIKQRVETIMPYLSYENDPYMITSEGKLYWMIDAYTTSDKYPYSEPYDPDTMMNYIRNSVKVVIDAYNGDVSYYIVDERDPIAQTFKKIYPKLFKDFDEMPEGLKSHIRYPNTMLEIQAQVYQRYHMSDVKVFYQNEDLWSIANEIYGTREKAMTPNYYILNLPGETKEEFVNTIAYTPKDKRNMMGLLLARNDGDNYGELVLFKMPKSKIVYGPMQVEAMIDQSTEISKEFSLWDSSGSAYSRGNMFIIPIEDSLLYVEPVYLEATNSSIPEVKRVIVVYGEKIAYEATLGECLNYLFGEGSDTATSPTEGDKNGPGGDPGADQQFSQSDLIEKANEAFNNAQEAQQDGDWAGYGRYMDELENYLSQLQ